MRRPRALLARLAEVLDVSIEALMGIERVSKQSTPLDTADLHLWRRVKRIAELPPHDRKAILKMIDAMANEAERRRAG